MLFGKHRVEEDLERIRKANLTPEKAEAERLAEEQQRKRIEENGKIGAKDFIALVFAAYSVVLPYVLVFIGV
ncbi:MAG: hypothetical protein RR368_02385, partial [Oscillospiraceae bacterium]